MFGDLTGMMQKLKETQKKVEETKKRLDTVLIDESSNDGKLKVTVTANSTIKTITMNDSLLSDADKLEDYLIITLNKALEKARKINETELAHVAKMEMPSIPGMNF
jgi:hypothetical protein